MLIALPAVELTRGQPRTIRVVMPGTVTGQAFTLTVREVPADVRAGLSDASRASADLDVAGWTATLSLTATGVGVNADFTLSRADALLLSPGYCRYVFDVQRTTGGMEAQVVGPTWLTVLNSVRDG